MFPVFGGETPPPQVSVTVTRAFTSFDGTRSLDCADIPGGCVIGVITMEDFPGVDLLAKAFDTIAFLPRLDAAPTRYLVDGATVAVQGSTVPAGDWTVAQCGRAYLDDPTPAQAAALCGPGTPVTASADGVFSVDVVVHDPLVPAAGGSVPCGHTGCALVLADPSTPVAARRAVAFGPTVVTVAPDELVVGSTMQVSVAGAPIAPYNAVRFSMCVLPVGPTVEDSRCADEAGYVAVDEWDSGTAEHPIFPGMSLPDGTVDCRVTACGMAVFDADLGTGAQSPPLVYAPPAELTLAPAEGLLDGQTITVTGRHLSPGVTVSPDDGLTDGQSVDVSAHDLMATYDGPTVLVPSGGWALTQCDAAVLDDLTLLGLFTHCSVPPPTRPVTVPDSTLDTTFAVESTITRILGGTTDCTASPGACAVGLVRFEQDTHLSSYLVTVDFGP